MEPTPGQRAALAQLAAVPGVVGSMVFDATGAVAFSEFPPVFDPGGLQELASRLAADGYFTEWLAGGKAVLDLRFGDGHVVVRAMDGAWLLVLCTAQVNAQLLGMSLTQVLRRLRLGTEPGRTLTGETPLATARAAPTPPPAPPAIERLRALVSVELGAQAPQALEILGAAGTSRPELERAVADVEQLTRLFISKKKAEELGRKMLGVLSHSL
jgi:predicted regulator of Ras-like GTPase activity (Roadblock/LC7/MglB family)